jgi:hypothetical protein
LQLICSSVDLVVDGIIRRLSINIPPQYGKSQIVSRSLPGFYLGKYPDRRIILTSYSAELSSTLSRSARNTLLSDPYQNLFTHDGFSVYLDPKNRSVGEWGLAAPHTGSFVSSGLGGSITGKGADLFIIDDPFKDDKEAQSYSIREDVWNAYWAVVDTRLSSIGAVILCMTRWHEDDLAGRLYRREKSVLDKYYVLRLPALAETEEQSLKWAEDNSIELPRLLTKRRVEEIRSEYESLRPTL